MARARRIFTDQFPYHITARCINKEWFSLPINEVWDIFSDHLYFCHHGFGCRIHAFVLMSNHFHLLMSTPLSNIDKAMQYLMQETSREIAAQTGRINQTYGGPYHSSLITKDIYFKHAYKYVYRNPADAGLCSRVEEYPYSSLAALVGITKSIIPLVADDLLIPEPEKSLAWLNTPYENQVREDLKLAMRRRSFKTPPCSRTKRQNKLETHLL